MPPRFRRFAGGGSSRSALTFSCSSSVNSERSEPLSRPAPAPLLLEAEARVSCGPGEGGGDGEGELRGSNEAVELGIVEHDEQV